MLDAHHDIRYEVLDLNSNGMYLCQSMALDEAEATLSEAYRRLQGDTTIADFAFLDQLKATTLNNLGVVQCHKGAHRKALDHLEAAYALESRAGWVSPTTSLNLCATHNALRHYDKATQHALRCIQSLHQTVLNNPDEDVSVLWGAAWHNLGVAQLNSIKPDEEESVNILSIFRNAMRATQDLLGPQHPMTLAVHETYRGIRGQLKDKGAFKQHEARTEPVAAMFPPLPSSRGGPRTVVTPRATTSSSGRRPAPELFVTLHGADRTTFREPAPPEPYITKELLQSRGGGGGALGAKPAPPAITVGSGRGVTLTSGAGGSTLSPRRRAELKRIKYVPALRGTLIEAGLLYSDPHPLLKHIKGAGRNGSPQRAAVLDSTIFGSGSGSGRSAAIPHPPSMQPATQRRKSPKQQQQQQRTPRGSGGAAGGFNNTAGSAGGGGGAGGAVPSSYRSPRRLSDLLAGDMWVELLDTTDAGMAMPGTTAPGSATRAPLRPAYAQALYAIDADALGSERVVEPASHAVLDHESTTTNAQYRHGQSPPVAPVGVSPPTDTVNSDRQQPARKATLQPGDDAAPRGGDSSDVPTAIEQLAAAGATDGNAYPGLAALRSSLAPSGQ